MALACISSWRLQCQVLWGFCSSGFISSGWQCQRMFLLTQTIFLQIIFQEVLLFGQFWSFWSWFWFKSLSTLNKWLNQGTRQLMIRLLFDFLIGWFWISCTFDWLRIIAKIDLSLSLRLCDQAQISAAQLIESNSYQPTNLLVTTTQLISHYSVFKL